jgi:hypothetical protein
MRRLLRWLSAFFREEPGDTQIAISGRDPVTGERWSFEDGEEDI